MRDQTIIILIFDLLIVIVLVLILKKFKIKTIKKYSSPISGNIFIRSQKNGEITLDINAYQQGISLENPLLPQTYWYYTAQKAVTLSPPNGHILCFGLGAATINQIIAKLNPNLRQTVIEIDPLIIKACREYFNIDSIKNLKIIEADAFEMAKNPNQFSDLSVILIDICTGQPPGISYQAASPEFISQIEKWLNPHGVLIFNRWINNQQNRQDTEKLKNYLQNRYSQITTHDIIDYHNFKNCVLTARLPLFKLSGNNIQN